MMFGCFNYLIILISFIRPSLPFSSAYVTLLENALIAIYCPSSTLSAKYTEAKFPFPIFLNTLNK